jgi:hypothetical protein
MMDKPPANEAVIDEVLPPDRASASTSAKKEDNDVQNESARILARWLDELFTIPGTKYKIGLDPILGLIPALGDLAASGAGMIIIAEAVRSRASISVVLRMGANMLLNAIANALPFIGPFFSAFYKSNTKNIALLHQWQAGHRAEAKRSSRLFLFGLSAAFAFVFLIWVALWILIIQFAIWPILRLITGQ